MAEQRGEMGTKTGLTPSITPHYTQLPLSVPHNHSLYLSCSIHSHIFDKFCRNLFSTESC